MNVKVEIASSTQIKNLHHNVEKILSVVPQEHLRGFTKIVFADLIGEPRLSAVQRASLPALYHPKMPGQMAWAEVALSVLAPKKKFPQNLLTRLSLKSSLAQVVLSLVAQHYYMTLSKGIKKNQLETACRTYVEKHFERWRDKEGGLRVRLLRPFKPQLDKMARKLARKYKEELERKQVSKR
jgi:hypothetical protein